MALQAVIRANYVCNNLSGWKVEVFHATSVTQRTQMGIYCHTSPAPLLPSRSPRVSCRTGSPLPEAETQNPVWQESRGESRVSRLLM